jgi:hypothetical protein
VKNGVNASPVAVMAVLLLLLLVVVVLVVVGGGGGEAEGERGAPVTECYKEERDILHLYGVKQ